MDFNKWNNEAIMDFAIYLNNQEDILKKEREELFNEYLEENINHKKLKEKTEKLRIKADENTKLMNEIYYQIGLRGLK